MNGGVPKSPSISIQSHGHPWLGLGKWFVTTKYFPFWEHPPFFGSTAVGLHCRRRKVGRSEGGRISTTKTDDITLTYFGEVNYISPSFWGSSDLRSRNMKYILYNYIYIVLLSHDIFWAPGVFFNISLPCDGHAMVLRSRVRIKIEAWWVGEVWPSIIYIYVY